LNSKLIFVISALVLVSLACSFSASTAKIKEVFMARDEQGQDRTTVFAQDDPFYCVVNLANAPDDTKLKAIWKVVSVEGEDPGMIIDQYELTGGSGTYPFSLTNDNLWPLGTYSVEVYMNDELQQTLEFTVQ
jgi:hypothetical protein